MDIVKVFPDSITKRELYQFIDSPDIVPVKSALGVVIQPDAYVIYEDDQKGEQVTITSIRDVDGTVYASNSPYVRQELEKIYSIYFDPADPTPIQIEFIEGTSKSGRTYKSIKLVL